MSRLERNFLALILAFAVMLAVVGFFAFKQITEDVIENWGQRLAENQVRYNSSRLLQPLEREIALAQQMARSPTLLKWAENPKNKQLHQAAMQELESFRKSFRAQNYFIALMQTREYYHNNANNDYLGSELRYTLRETRPADAWFFRLIEEGRDFHININPDVELGVTKLWVDILMRNSEGQILAVLGTGMPLEDIVVDLLTPDHNGIQSLFVDVKGAIQLYQDLRLIDFASFVQPEGQKRTIDLVVDLPEEGQMLLETMRRMHQEPDSSRQVVTRFVTVEGQRHLVGIAYLPTIGWFDVTFLNLTEIMPRGHFWPLAGVILIALILVLIIIHYVLRSEILIPLTTLSQEMEHFGRTKGKSNNLENVYHGELGRVFRQFQNMAGMVHANTEQLEAMVAERTKELEIKARVDSVTGLFNRVAMTEFLERESARCARTEDHYGIIWIDVDDFKNLNDTHGHGAGDLLLKELGKELLREVRLYDYAARWGGDEFLILISSCDNECLNLIGKRVREAIESNTMFKKYQVTVSTGGALSGDNDSYEDVLAKSDADLYRAKSERNLVK